MCSRKQNQQFASLFAIVLLGATPGLAVTITVNTTADVLADDGQCSLREAVIAANEDFPSGSQPGECPAGNAADEIVIGPGTYRFTIPGTGEGAAATGDLDITESVTLTGSGAGNCVIDGNFLDRVFQFLSSAGAVTITALTIQRGALSGFDGDGGGIYNDTSLTLSNAVVRNNTADDGGGIINRGTLILMNSSVIDNTSDSRGGGSIKPSFPGPCSSTIP